MPSVTPTSNTLGKPSILWSGRITGTEPENGQSFDGKAGLAVVQKVRGGWHGLLDIRYDREDARGSIGAGVVFSTKGDPREPGALLAIRLGQRTADVFILPPVGAVSVRAVDKQGKVVAQAEVSDDVALIKVPDPIEVSYEALDSAGTVIGRADLAGQATFGAIDRFGQR